MGNVSHDNKQRDPRSALIHGFDLLKICLESNFSS